MVSFNPTFGLPGPVCMVQRPLKAWVGGIDVMFREALYSTFFLFYHTARFVWQTATQTWCTDCTELLLGRSI